MQLPFTYSCPPHNPLLANALGCISLPLRKLEQLRIWKGPDRQTSCHHFCKACKKIWSGRVTLVKRDRCIQLKMQPALRRNLKRAWKALKPPQVKLVKASGELVGFLPKYQKVVTSLCSIDIFCIFLYKTKKCKRRSFAGIFLNVPPYGEVARDGETERDGETH